VLVTVNLYDPTNGYYHFVFPNSYVPAIGSDGSPLTDSGPYETHFRPDHTDTTLEQVLRAFGMTTTEIDSTYLFPDDGTGNQGARAGDDIDICHVTTGGEEPKTCLTTDVNDATHAITADQPSDGVPDDSPADGPDKKVNVTIHTDVAWSGASAAPALDDPGISIDLPQIWIRTNGNVIDTEIVGDLLAGHVHSTNGDVTLNSPIRILDADRRPTIDVTGENITMNSGLAGGVGGIGLPSLPFPNLPATNLFNLTFGLGGYLEINTAVNGSGVLKADDTASDGTMTLGIYLDELTGDMPVHTVKTDGSAGDLTTGNVSLRTVNGSIVDGKHAGSTTDDAEVIGQTVDLDANGGSIGASGNDLEIDSSVGSNAPCVNATYPGCADSALTVSDPGLAAANDDVGLEATQSIYLTEVSSYLRLFLAHAVNGDIRITVRDSSAHDEDLFLIHDGSAQFAESNNRLPSGDDVDDVRVVPIGTILAESGNVTLQVGDNVATHQNSRIVAHQNIDIYGDFHFTDPDPDAGYGTNMILRGAIVADAVVTKGPDSGDPMGTYVPSSAAHPLATTQVWGNSDIDTFQLGDPSGDDPLNVKTTLGSPGYIFLGSKTQIYGTNTAPVCGASSCLSADVDLYAAGDRKNLDEDNFLVWYLQSMNVVTDPSITQPPTAGLGAGAGHSLTLDGQSDTDYYTVHTTGSHRSPRNYVINVLDTGAENNGQDELAIFGADDDAAVYPQFNGYVADTTTRNGTDDIFLLRAEKCIDTETPYAVNGAVPSVCTSPIEKADRPAFVALLTGNDDPDGGLGLYRDRVPNNEPTNKIQRINYDTALNGRLSVFGLGGNDAFFVDDTTAIATLDGGAGYDLFQIGQIFGTKRDQNITHDPVQLADGGALLPTDTFPVLVATTRGWLSPGPHAPLVANGGTGNDEFVVYSNQAELRLEGDDDNDLFVVRAFALAAVCDTDATGDGLCTWDDVSLEADPLTSLYPVDPNHDGVCTALENPTYGGDGWNPATGRKDNNGDHVCNKADAHITGAATATADADPTKWEDDVIPLNPETGAASPIIGLGFSTGRPIDIRAGGGEDEVQYNVNAPVSIDGGTGFDKLVVLGTEFADDFVITSKAIYGAGLNVRYTTVEVVEVDGLEGDDEFFILSTAFGVAYRVIGGLGSDTINVTGDVVEDIVTRELEGLSGTIDHRVYSVDANGNVLDPLYNGMPADGLDYNLATPDAGVVVIKESGAGTSVREGGSIAVGVIDYYDVYLSHAPTSNVYVTVSAARDPQEWADNALSGNNPAPLPNGPGDTIWLCTGTASECTDPTTHADSHFKRYKIVNGTPVDENGRALALTFTPGAWNESSAQRVYVYAVDDPRSEGDRVVVVQHSVISDDASFDAALVRNVEVTVYDNDTPGIFVTEIEQAAVCPGVNCTEDKRTVVVEGSIDPAVGEYTGTDDDILIQLAKRPDPGQIVVVKLSMDTDTQKAISLSNTAFPDSRWAQHTAADGGTYYTITFRDPTLFPNDWETPVRVRIIARDDPRREDPETAVIAYSCDASANTVCGVYNAVSNAGATFQFPNLRSGPGRTAVTVIDNDTAGLVVRESGVDTVVVKCGDPLCLTPGPTDDYWIRLTKRPENPNDPNHLTETTVKVAVLTDGLVDVKSINGTLINYASLTDPLLQQIGGYLASRLFLGNLTFGIDGSGHLTLTRANGSEMGSFVEEGFEKNQLVLVGGPDAGHSGQFHVYSVTDGVLTVLETTPAWSSVTTTDKTTTVSRLTMSGKFEGQVKVEIVPTSPPDCETAPNCRRLELLAPNGSDITGTDSPGWLAAGFLEGQRVLVCDSSAASDADATHCGRFKIAIIRGDNESKDNKLEFTAENPFPAGWTNGATLTVKVIRLGAVATFDDGEAPNPGDDSTTDWFREQHIVLVADLQFSQPIVRDGVKIFPVSTHVLSKLQGPLAVEGGPTGADRSLNLGVKLPGEQDGPLFAIGPQPPESKQIDVLNIFNDGSQEDGVGTMTSTTIKGFKLAKDLDFGPTYSSGNPQTFGEPAVFPGGISFGSVQFVDGTFATDGGKSTVEVVNLMLGQGNDHFQVNGTLDPDDAVKLIGSIIIVVRNPGTVGPSDPGGVDVTRSQPFDWTSQGFLAGAPVHITGLAGTWKVLGFSDSFGGDTTLNTVMRLVFVPTPEVPTPPAPPYQTTQTVTVSGVTTNGSAFGGSLTAAAGSWTGFAVNQQVFIGTAGPWQVLAVTPTMLLLGNGPAISDAVGSVTLTHITPVLRTTTADDVPVTVTLPVTIVTNDTNPLDDTPSDGGTVTRATGKWTDDGFIVGQWVMIDGIQGIGWRLLDISDDGKTLTLGRGSPLPSSPSTTRTVFVPGPHGGLTMVHGGGNLPLSLAFENTLPSNTVVVGPNSVTRNDGLAWVDDGYAQLFANGLPQHIQVGGAAQTRTIASFGDAPCTLSDPYPGCGKGSVINFTTPEPALAPAAGKTLVYVSEAKRSQQTGLMNITVGDTDGPDGPAVPTSTLTCPSCHFITAGFIVGMQVTISGSMVVGSAILDVGLPGQYTVTARTETTITLANVALTPTLTGLNQPGGAPVPLTVTGYNPLLHETDPTVYGTGTLGFRIGGDTITVGIAKTATVTFNHDRLTSAGVDWAALGFAAGQTVQITGVAATRVIDSISAGTMIFKPAADLGTTTVANTTVALAGSLAGPNSPLVVYGDTSQDGTWYAGHPDDILGYEFGPKPFDPFTKIPDAENEDDEWIFPLANPYAYAGHDVIDGGALFAGVTCTMASCNLPSVGFTVYGGEGNDLIIGSQTGDHLAGGSGDDEIQGARGVDHIYGDSGVNVNILTRGLTIDTVNASSKPTITKAGFINNGTTIEPYPADVADAMDAGRDLIYGEGPHTVGTFASMPQTAFDDIIFGDHGAVVQQVVDPNLPDKRLQKIQTTLLSSVRKIESRNYQNGNDDVVFGGLGRDVIVGGAGNDMLDGDQADDLVFGDQIFLLRRVTDPALGAQTDWAGPADITSGRFQTLCGTLLYSRTDRPDACSFGNPVGTDNSGQLLTNGVWQDFRDPDSPGLDAYPWWAEYAVEYSDGDPTLHFHDFASDRGFAGAGSFGNDYIAGSEGNDLLFGQLGNDTIQGDGGIELAFARMVDNAHETALSTIVVTTHVSASRTPDGCTGTPMVNLSCDYIGDLDVVPSFEAPTDGEDYIEGNGGKDIIFGGLGQDDILGGSSDFFSLADQVVTISGLVGTWRVTGISADGTVLTVTGATLPTAANVTKTITVVGGSVSVTGTVSLAPSLYGGTITRASFNWAAAGFVLGADERPDGPDLIYGGAGTREDRNVDTIPTTTDQAHARDADTVVGDNGRIVRIVGTNNVDLHPQGAGDQRYVRFAYDNYSPATGYDVNGKIIVRGVQLLDYTPGGPDFAPASFFDAAHEVTPCINTGADAQGKCSTPLPICSGEFTGGSKYVDIGGRDEVHGESGDDTVYTGCGNDIIYGDGQDDDLIGGWGNDWISGGTGQDGILGDDGRIFTSRNTRCLPNSTAVCTTLTEPLYGIYGFRGIDPDTKVIHGDVINEFIYTPGQVQTATINIEFQLKKEFDITPYNLGPNDLAGHFQIDVPTYDANNSDDVIFGGWNNPFVGDVDLSRDFLHGGAGDDAISGAEALRDSYVQHYNSNPSDGIQDGLPDGLVRTDWTRPWNPGNILYFGADFDPWNDPKPFQSRLGEFFLYDEFDARRPILFNAASATWGCTATDPSGHTCISQPPLSAFPYQYFLNLPISSDPLIPGEGYLSPLSCILTNPNGTCAAYGRIYSDGDDLIFGDLGNDWMVGGTGKDDIYSGWGNDLANADDLLTTNGSLNDVPDEHGWYNDRVYGGAGVDILMGNTFADRLIDWVGEWDTYLVPFSPFGIGTVSRQVEPFLPEFLYALSASDGADPTRDTDTGSNITRPGRNGEYEGEMGLIIQADHEFWQSQTGGPTDPQSGGVPGGSRTKIAAADFNNGNLGSFAPDSGVWQVSSGTLQVSAASLGKDAAAVFYVDEYLPVYYEVAAKISTQKPTAGWNANAYVIFDYFSPTDFKFAGLDVSLNQFVMGYRDVAGWHTVVHAPVLGSVQADTWYDVLVAVNGTTVSVSANGEQAFTYTFAARILNGEAVGLNKGFVGAGSNNARGSWDDVAVQVLPPQLTLDSTASYTGGVGPFTGESSGTWTVNAGRYEATAGSGSTIASTADLGPDRLNPNSWIEVTATLRTTGIGGIVFDFYGLDRYKFAALDVTGQQVLVGHVEGGRFVIDASVAKTLAANTDYTVVVTIKGSSVSVTVGGSFALSYAFNASGSDGQLGLLSRSGTTSVDSIRIKTNDAAFANIPRVSVGDVSLNEGGPGAGAVATLTLSLSQAATTATSVGWSTVAGTAVAGTDFAASSGIATFAPGTTSVQISIPLIGDAIGEANEIFYVALAAPNGLTISDDAGQVTILNDDATPTVTVAATDSVGGEQGQNPLVFTVTRAGSASGSLGVNLTWGGTAAYGVDYTVSVTGGTLSANGATVTLADGVATATVTVTPVDDTAVESSETVTLTVGAGAGYTVGSPASANGAIADNDVALPTLSVDSVTVTEGDRNTTTVNVTVRLSAASTSTVTVVASTVAGSALAGSDFQSKTATLTFAPGATTATFQVSIVNDRTKESTEAFTIQLSNPSGATIASGTGTVTIIDNDGAMLAAEVAPADATGVRPLTAAALASVVEQGKAMWRAVLPGADFSGYTITIGELSDPQLGWTEGLHTTIDVTAAGWGWSRMDLLTVVLHELGRALGFTTDDAGRFPVMSATLEPGQRLVLVHGDVALAERLASVDTAPRVAVRLIGPNAAPRIVSPKRLAVVTSLLGAKRHVHLSRRTGRGA
jgi:Calx-beta domain/RTX calcium-binding nonapeptide repeat (4 copies)